MRASLEDLVLADCKQLWKYIYLDDSSFKVLAKKDPIKGTAELEDYEAQHGF